MEECYRAKVSTHEYGPNDDRNFCYGLYSKMFDDYLDECWKCGSFCLNAKPIEKED